ncbi:hypothetical protein BDZ97DRAFT_1916391 [Flammula alnicola]|nr:hypothetical protein BDZ97DRAFT_1916391 [Flammula alnicola]
MSRTLPPVDTIAPDPLISSDIASFSPARHSHTPHPRQSGSSSYIKQQLGSNMQSSSTLLERTESDESIPLLHPQQPRKKPFYRPRPLWLVPFAVLASLVRGMTLAPRVEVFTQLSCNRLHGNHNWNHTQTSSTPQLHQLHTSLYTSIDPLGPHFLPSAIFPSPQQPRIVFQRNASSEYASTTQTLTTIRRLGSEADDDTDRRDSDDTEDPRRIPSARCLEDPAVQAGAARLQTIMTTTMGLLSALTTGWWGHFGERHGRTKVLAISTLGLFLTDLTFILVSTPSSPLSKHGHNLLLLAPIIEGLLGAGRRCSRPSPPTSATAPPPARARTYSAGSRASSPVRRCGGTRGEEGGTGQGQGQGEKVVTAVFWVAIACSFFNFVMMLFVFPESLDKKKQERAAYAHAHAHAQRAVADGKGKARARGAGALEGIDEQLLEDESSASGSGSGEQEVAGEKGGHGGVIARFLSPLAVFLPVMVLDPSPTGLGSRKRRDWSLTMLAVALFGFMLSTGMYQIKYLYAVHTYGWGAEQLSYYISFMGGGRAVWLLFGLPTLIGFFKPKPLPANASTTANANTTDAKGKLVKPAGAEPQAQSEQAKTLVKGKKPKPTRAQLGHEIGFDLILTRCSLLVDVVSHTLVAVLPAPALKAHMQSTLAALSTSQPGGDVSFNRSQAMFVLASSLNGMGSGAVPAIHSLALCMLQVRALNARSAVGVDGQGPGQADEEAKEEEGTGALFGALAVLQAVGQMIVGPMLFGLIYSGTVANFPKAIFVTAAGLMVFALSITMCVRNPVHVLPPVRGPGKGVRRRRDGDVERGRSRVSKDLRGGAIGYHGYGSTASSSTTSTRVSAG